MIDKLSLHSRLSAQDCAGLLELPHTSRSFEAGSHLIREGYGSDRCSLLVAGLAYGYKISGEGQRQIVSIHVPGDVFDLQHLFVETADHGVRTLTHAEVVSVPHNALRDFAADHPAVANAFVTTMLVDLAVAREWMLNIGRRDARTRIAHLLCELATRLGQRGLPPGQNYELPMTQEQLGDAVGLTAVHVNRILKGLARDGLVIHHKHGVIIPDWERLVRVADFSRRYLYVDSDFAANHRSDTFRSA